MRSREPGERTEERLVGGGLLPPPGGEEAQSAEQIPAHPRRRARRTALPPAGAAGLDGAEAGRWAEDGIEPN